MTREIVRFSPTSEVDGGGAQHIKWGQSSPIKLVFWVELDRGLGWLGSGGPRPGRVLARGYSAPGRFPLRILSYCMILDQVEFRFHSGLSLESFTRPLQSRS